MFAKGIEILSGNNFIVCYQYHMIGLLYGGEIVRNIIMDDVTDWMPKIQN